jgi:hypothetical protein
MPTWRFARIEILKGGDTEGPGARRRAAGMKRDLERLAQNNYDSPSSAAESTASVPRARQARRGLAVCLLEKGDFGEATSANSLRIVTVACVTMRTSTSPGCASRRASA